MGRHKRIDPAEAFELHRAGVPLAELAEKYGVTVGSLRTVMARQGLRISSFKDGLRHEIHDDDIARAANLFDRRGSVIVDRRTDGNLRLDVSIMSTGRDVPEWLVTTFNGHTNTISRERISYINWSIESKQAEDFLSLIIPHLEIKADQARLGLRFRETFRRGAIPTPEMIEERLAIQSDLRRLRGTLGQTSDNDAVDENEEFATAPPVPPRTTENGTIEQPAVGRMVHYILPVGSPHAGEHRPAIISKVWIDMSNPSYPGLSNLSVFKGQMDDFDLEDLPLFEEEDGGAVVLLDSVCFGRGLTPGTWHFPEAT